MRSRIRLGVAANAAFVSVAMLSSPALAVNKLVSEDSPFKDKMPRVFVWGDNTRHLVPDSELVKAKSGQNYLRDGAVRTPTPVALLDGQKLRSLAVSPEFGLAVLTNGDVVQFSSLTLDLPTKKLKEAVVLKNIKSVRISPRSATAVALSGNGTVWAWLGVGMKPQEFTINSSMGWFERVVDIECGESHVLARTNKGRVFSGSLPRQKLEATKAAGFNGMTDAEQMGDVALNSAPSATSHEGQFGIALFPHFERPPPDFELHPIKLLPGKVNQIACGPQHSLFVTEKGELWGAGSNMFGQLLRPYTYKNTRNSVPVFIKADVDRCAAGNADVTFYRQIADRSKVGSVDLTTEIGKKWFVAGDGEFGHFGTGSYNQCQVQPLEVKPVSTLREYDEIHNSVVPVTIDRLEVGATHVFGQMNDSTGSWLVWGSNERGQLGNGKLSKSPKPIPVSSTTNLRGSEGYTFVAGDKVSGCYVHA